MIDWAKSKIKDKREVFKLIIERINKPRGKFTRGATFIEKAFVSKILRSHLPRFEGIFKDKKPRLRT
jgi:hypothetical protein